jgi:hypothetical protein
VDRIWSFGPRRTGTNVLVNCVPGFAPASVVWGHACGDKADAPGDEEQDPRRDLDGFVITGFQMAALAGPICEEPMTGVAFLVEEWTIENLNKDVRPSEEGLVQLYTCIYLPITYYWTGLLILDHSYLVGNLTNSRIAATKALQLLKS